MTGFESKRKATLAKLDLYQSGFDDGKRSAQRKPLTDAELVKLVFKCGLNGLNIHGYTFARAIEAAHNIKEQP